MISETIIPPGLILIVVGLLLPFVPRTIRNLLQTIGPLATLMIIWTIPDGTHLTANYLGYELVLLEADNLSRFFATVFAMAATAGGLYAVRQDKSAELGAAMVYAGSSLGVVFAGDLLTVFVFWEVMAIASTIVVFSGGPSARGAGMRYAVIHFLGGVLFMAGVAGELVTTGSADFDVMQADSWSRWLILAGFLVNAGAPPLSAWVSDAYPASSWSGAVFLSAFTTKTAVFVLIKTFPGTDVLIYIGLFMVFYGIFYAVMENDMRRVLTYSIINQVGFMVVAIGIGSEVALNGAAAHAFAHIIYKALLLMSIGAVMYRIGKTKATELGGLFRTMPITMICGVIGALSISAFPGTSGFAAKSLVTGGAADAKLAFVWFSLTAASAAAFFYVGIKFPWFTFFDRDSGERPDEAPASMLASMVVLAVMCVIIGVAPSYYYSFLPYPIDYEPNTFAHIVSQLLLLLFAGLVFFLALKFIRPTNTVTLDFDWLYRVPGRKLGLLFNEATASLWKAVSGMAISFAGKALKLVYRLHGPDGIFSETWSTGLMAFWTTVLLGLYLVFYFI